MKKLVSLMLAVAMLLSLASIGLAAESNAAVMIYKYDDTYISTVRAAIEKYAADTLAVTLYDGKGDQATQNDQIDTVLAKGTDILVVNMVDAKAVQGVLDKAVAEKLPVVFFNREPDAEILKTYEKAIFIGTNAADAGVMQGDIVKQLWDENAAYDLNGDGKIQYLMFQGEPDNAEAIARTEFSVKRAEELGLVMDLVEPVQVCNWDPATAQTAMEAILNKGTAVELVLCNNDGMAQGVIAALNASGYNLEVKEGEAVVADKYLPVVGVDATEAAIDLINKGMMAATVKQDGDAMGKAIVTIAAAFGADKTTATVLEGTDYVLDASGVAVRIPYAPYVPEK